MQLHCQCLEILMEPTASVHPMGAPLLSRAQRAHYRLAWQARLLRNARAPGAAQITLKLFGVPDTLAAFLGLSSTAPSSH